MGPSALAEELSEHRDAIIQCWREHVSGTVSPAGGPPAEILNSLPEFMNQLVLLLRRADDPATAQGLNAPNLIAVDHGAQRFHAGFSIGSVVREYAVLRQCLLSYLHDHDLAVGFDQLQLILNAVNAAIVNAAEQF